MITNLETGQVVEVSTDEEGNYSAKLLRIGRYSVKAEKQGFQSAIETDVDVGINQVVRVDFSLSGNAWSYLRHEAYGFLRLSEGE